MSQLKISVAGIRGIVGKNVTPEIFAKYAAVFGDFCGGPKAKIVIGSDSRHSNQMLRYAVYAGLMSVGCETIDLGICPTPTVGIMIKHLQADGGIVISASHNPQEWNGLKLVAKDGIFVDETTGSIIKAQFEGNKINRVINSPFGKVSTFSEAVKIHKEKILNAIDRSAIAKRKFKIVLDCINGAGSLLLPELLSDLGCETFLVNCKPTGDFVHDPEPLPEHLQTLCELVKEKQADLGLACDPDADRLAVVSDEGKAIGEEYTLALAVYHILNTTQPKQGSIVINLSTSRMVEDIVQAYNTNTNSFVKVVRTKIGEAHVARTMQSLPNSIIGGEGNGGVIYPKTHYGRDAGIACGLILEALARIERLSHLIELLPQYHMVKRKISYPADLIPLLLTTCYKELPPGGEIDQTDGLRISYPDLSWVHIRPSGTEPVVRIVAEAKTREQAIKLCDFVNIVANKLLVLKENRGN